MRVGQEVERKEEAFRNSCSRKEAGCGRALSWAGPPGGGTGLGNRPGRPGGQSGPGGPGAQSLTRGAGRGCAMGREAQGQSCPGLALARPPGSEGRQESLCPTLRTDGVRGGGLRPKCIPSPKDRSPPPNSRPATSLLTSSASSLKGKPGRPRKPANSGFWRLPPTQGAGCAVNGPSVWAGAQRKRGAPDLREAELPLGPPGLAGWPSSQVWARTWGLTSSLYTHNLHSLRLTSLSTAPIPIPSLNVD